MFLDRDDFLSVIKNAPLIFVVLAHEFITNVDLRLNDQHEEYRWFSLNEILSATNIHKYTKNYFLGRKQ